MTEFLRNQVDQARLLERLLESVNDLVWCTSADGNRLYFLNQAASRIYGRPLDELKENPEIWLESVHPDDRVRVTENLKQISTSGNVEQTYRILRPDGEVRWLQDHIHVINEEDGSHQYVGGITTNITTQMTADQSFRESQAVYRSLVESLPLNVVRKNARGEILFCNQRYCDTLNRPFEELQGKTDSDLFPPLSTQSQPPEPEFRP